MLATISHDLKIEMVDRQSLIPYARNARTHSEEQVNQIAASIREFGFTSPLLIDEANNIIAGHGRLSAAIKCGMATVPAIRLTGMSEAKKRALILADNKLALNADWSIEALKLELTDLESAKFDLSLTGFSTGELTAMYFDGEFAPDNSEQGSLDNVGTKEIECPNCGEKFVHKN